MSYEKHRIGELSPVLIVTIEGTGPGEVIFYSHLDKQPSKPELWSEGLHPLKAVRRIHGSMAGAPSMMGMGIPLRHICKTPARGGCPPSPLHHGYRDMRGIRFIRPPNVPGGTYRELGNPDMVVVLDSGGPDYDHIWMTEALRGLVSGTLSVKVSHEGIHSGNSGAHPSSFRIQRILLDRVEDSSSGKVRIPEMHVEIPESQRERNLSRI